MVAEKAPVERLFVYGTLQPGEPNAHVLAGVEGDWTPAVVRGRLVAAGWGARMGYRGLRLDAHGDDVHGHVLASSRLRDEWARLDAFEGEDYARVTATVRLASGERVSAQVYVLR